MLFPGQGAVTIGVLRVLGRVCWSPRSCFWWGTAGQAAQAPGHTAVQEDFTCTPDPTARAAPWSWCRLLSRHRAGEEDEPTLENNVNPSRGGHVWHYMKLFYMYGALLLWLTTAICDRKGPFWLSVTCRSFMLRGKYSRYQVQPDVHMYNGTVGLWIPKTGLKVTELLSFHCKQDADIRSASCGGGFSRMRDSTCSLAAGTRIWESYPPAQ